MRIAVAGLVVIVAVVLGGVWMVRAAKTIEGVAPAAVAGPEGETIFGRAVFEDGLSAAGLVIDARQNCVLFSTVTVGADGSFRVCGETSDPVEFNLIGPVARTSRLIEVRNGRKDRFLSFSADARSSPLIVLRRRPCIVGRLLESDGAPARRSGVSARFRQRGSDAWRGAGLENCDADGRFAVPIDDLAGGAEAAGIVELTAWAPLLADLKMRRSLSTLAADVDVGATRFPSRNLVQFLALDPADRPVGDVQLELDVARPALSSHGEFTIMTGADGRASAEGRGRFGVRARRDGFNQFVTIVDTESGVEVSPCVIRMVRAGDLLARCAGPADATEGLFLRVATDSAIDDDGMNDEPGIIVDEFEGGVARIDCLRSGTAYSAELQDVVGPLAGTRASVAPLLPSEIRRLEMPAPPPRRALAGTVVDAKGRPVPVVDFHLESVGSDAERGMFDETGLKGTTGMDGRFGIDGLRRDAVRVTLRITDAAVSRIVACASPRVEETFVLEPQRDLVCRVVDRAGRPVPADDWTLTAFDGSYMTHARVLRPKLPDGAVVFSVGKQPVRVRAIIADKIVEGGAGADESRVDIVAADIGYVRIALSWEFGGSRTEPPPTVIGTADGGASYFEIADLAAVRHAEPASIERPLRAGTWRLTFAKSRTPGDRRSVRTWSKGVLRQELLPGRRRVDWRPIPGAATPFGDIVVAPGNTADVSFDVPR